MIDSMEFMARPAAVVGWEVVVAVVAGSVGRVGRSSDGPTDPMVLTDQTVTMAAREHRQGQGQGLEQAQAEAEVWAREGQLPTTLLPTTLLPVLGAVQAVALTVAVGVAVARWVHPSTWGRSIR